MNVPATELVDGQIWICKLMVLLDLATSNKEAGRAIAAGSVNIRASGRRSPIPKSRWRRPMG